MIGETPSLRQILARLWSGSKWLVGGNSLQNALGLLLTLLMARMLEPSDLGLLALAWLTFGALDVLSRSGAADAMIHRREDIDAYLATFFWMECLRGALLAAVAVALSPVIANAFNEPAAALPIALLGLVAIARSCRSPGLVLLRRNLNFRRESVFNVCAGLCGFILAGTALVIWRNLLITVAALVLAEFIACLLSYLFCPYRPRFTFNLQRAATLLRYGRWLFGSGLFSYLAIYLDRYVIGRLADASLLGLYTVAAQLGEALTFRISKLISLALQPAYANLQLTAGAAELFRITFRLTLIPLSLITAVAWALAPAIIPLLLGERWIEAVPAFSLFVISGYLRAMAAAGSPYFKGIGHPQAVFKIECLRFVVLALALVPAYHFGGINGAAAAVLLATAVQVGMTLQALRMLDCINAAYLLRLLPMVTAALIIAGLLRVWHAYAWPQPMLYTIGACATVFAYGTFIWLSEGRWLRSTLFPASRNNATH